MGKDFMRNWDGKTFTIEGGIDVYVIFQPKNVCDSAVSI